MILAGDIGGTKSHFGVFDDTRLVFERRLANADFSSFENVIETLLATPQLRDFPLQQAKLAVAGPVNDDGRGARMTNLSWAIDGPALEARFGLPPIKVANDFAAAALGSVTADAADLVTLQAGEPLATAPRLVLGAGTGLGMAIVLPEVNGWRVIPGEGGHVAFAPADDEQLRLWRFLNRRHGRVTWERVVSGPGLAAIHACLSDAGHDDDPGRIGEQGLAEPESVAGQALRLFCSLYGAYAGDMALPTLPRGGVFLAGGIATKIMPALAQAFIPAFTAKANHTELIRRMPVHIVSDPHLALRGAARL